MNEELLFSLMVDLHLDGERQGPGSEEQTLRALSHTQLDTSSPLKVADIGCGTGASTLVLAKSIPNAQITAVDLFPEFLNVLKQRVEAEGVSAEVKVMERSMDTLPFTTDSFDLTWSEGARR